MIKENFYLDNYNISIKAHDFVLEIEKKLSDKFEKLNNIEEYNLLKIINAMQEEKLSATDFNWPTGYGYGDVGREKVESIYANIFKTEDALVRPSIASGTHALALTLQGLLLPGDTLLSITGDPYDTLRQVIGIEGDEVGTLIECGINYNKIELKDDGSIDEELVLEKLLDEKDRKSVV